MPASVHADIFDGLSGGQFVLFYQPKIHLPTQRIESLEALVRWQHPTRGLLLPGLFLAEIEKHDLLEMLWEVTLHQACAQVKTWFEKNLVCPIAVNVSPSVLERDGFVEDTVRVIDCYGIPRSLIELEITEHSLASNISQAERICQQLRDAGLRISIDDFGTGFSCLSYLTNFQIDVVKLDRSFTAQLAEQPKVHVVLKYVVEMGRGLGFDLIAEGIETPDQSEALQQLGIEKGQGWLFSQALPPDQIESLLRESV